MSAMPATSQARIAEVLPCRIAPERQQEAERAQSQG